MTAVGYKQKFRAVSQHFRFTPDSRHSCEYVRFHADFVRFTLGSGPNSGTG